MQRAEAIFPGLRNGLSFGKCTSTHALHKGQRGADMAWRQHRGNSCKTGLLIVRSLAVCMREPARSGHGIVGAMRSGRGGERVLRDST